MRRCLWPQAAWTCASATRPLDGGSNLSQARFSSLGGALAARCQTSALIRRSMQYQPAGSALPRQIAWMPMSVVEVGIMGMAVDHTPVCMMMDMGFARRVVALMFVRSEEHTSELQSLMRNSYTVFCL